MHRLIFQCLTVLFAASAAQALDFPKPVRPGQEEWRKPYIAALEKKITADFKKKPFDEVIDFIRQESKVNVVVDPAAVPNPKPTVNFTAQNQTLAQTLKQMLQPIEMEFEVRDEAIFIYNPKKVDKNMLLPEDLPIARMLDGRAEHLALGPENMPAGDLLKELTEGPGIKMAIDPAIAKTPITLRFADVHVGFAIRWVVRFAGGKIIVDRDGMKAAKR
jgi:hypothetical protein